MSYSPLCWKRHRGNTAIRLFDEPQLIQYKDTYGILKELKCSMIAVILLYVIMAIAWSSKVGATGSELYNVTSFLLNWINFAISCITPSKTLLQVWSLRYLLSTVFQVYGLTWQSFRAMILQHLGREVTETEITYSVEHFYQALLDNEYYQGIKAYAVKEWTVTFWSDSNSGIDFTIDGEHGVSRDIYDAPCTGRCTCSFRSNKILFGTTPLLSSWHWNPLVLGARAVW